MDLSISWAKGRGVQHPGGKTDRDEAAVKGFYFKHLIAALSRQREQDVVPAGPKRPASRATVREPRDGQASTALIRDPCPYAEG